MEHEQLLNACGKWVCICLFCAVILSYFVYVRIFTIQKLPDLSVYDVESML